jgi:threonine/homoserine/homoserine lactone efflux protein
MRVRRTIGENGFSSEPMLNFVFKGLAIGLSIAAPVGPIAVLCIRRSLADGRRVGLVTGLGAASADAIYGGVAAFGLTAVSTFLVGQRAWLSVLGGGFLCVLGGRTFLSRPAENAVVGHARGLRSAYTSTFFLTLTNPMTILSFVAVFAALGLGASADYVSAVALVTGVFVGSTLWWVMLSAGVALFRSRLSAGVMQSVNRLSGAVIVAFGLYALSTVVF